MIFSHYLSSVLISSHSNLLGLNNEIMCTSYKQWGPSARNCVRFARDPKEISHHAEDVSQAVSKLTKNAIDLTSFNDHSTLRVFVIRPSPDSRRLRTMEFGTNHLREIVVLAYAQQEYVVRYKFYKTIRGNPWFSGPVGELYKIHILLWFLHTRADETLLCTGAEASFPELQLPSCPTDPKFFLKPEELAKISEPDQPKCLIPTSRNFPTLDAIVLTSDSIITVQITISSKHDATGKGFGLIYNNLPHDMKQKRPNRYHLYITDEETNAKSLQEQNWTDIPTETRVYSTVIGVEHLESKVQLTHDRVKALQKAKVSMCGLLCVIWYSLGNM